MSTTEAPEKEIEVVAGTIGSPIKKKEGTWQIEVDTGQQNPKRLWTKDAELVKALDEKFGQHGAFVCGASYWTNQSGAEVRSLWINSLSDGTENVQNATVSPSTAPKVHASGNSDEGMSKDEWRRKDSAADKRALTAIAVSALTHTMPSEPTEKDLATFLERVDRLVLTWHAAIARERDELPFQ